MSASCVKKLQAIETHPISVVARSNMFKVRSSWLSLETPPTTHNMIVGTALFCEKGLPNLYFFIPRGLLIPTATRFWRHIFHPTPAARSRGNPPACFCEFSSTRRWISGSTTPRGKSAKDLRKIWTQRRGALVGGEHMGGRLADAIP